VLRFGVFELDSSSGELRKAGVLVKLRQQPAKVLGYLAARPGQLVTREELQTQVWGGDTFVDFDQGLNYCIKEIRAALADSAETPLYVETLPRRGYRFIAPVEGHVPTPTAVAMPEPARPRRWPVWPFLVTTLAALALAGYVATRCAPEPADWQRLTFRRGALTAARFAPGGEVVFSAAWDGEPGAVYAIRPGAPDARRVLDQPVRLVSVSDRGDIVFLEPRAGGTPALARAPLAGGATKPLLDNVVAADGTADGSAFAVAHVVVGEGPRIEYPVGRVLARVNAPTHLRLSPDGSALAFIEHPRTGDDMGFVAILDASGTALAHSATFASAEGLAWSPAGDEVWFTAAQSGGSLALRALDRQGRTRTLLPASGRLLLHDVSRGGELLLDRAVLRLEIGFVGADGVTRDLPWLDAPQAASLSADGRTLLFGESGEAGGPGYSVYLRRTDGSLPVRLGSGVPCSLTPDGRFAVVVPLVDPDRIEFVPTGAGETRSLRYDGIVQYDWAALTPDGARVVFVGRQKDHNLRVWVGALDGGSPRPITPDGLIVARDTISPDGRWLLAGCPPRQFCLYPLDGGEPQRLPRVEGFVPTSWDPSGQALYLRADGAPGRLVLESLDLKSGARSAFREIGPRDPVGVGGIGRVTVSRDGSSIAFNYARRLSELYRLPRLDR
jgi:DNA-binding winged helix-turn-helix (wHTH) protein